MQKLTHQLAGELGETLVLAKLQSLGLRAYTSPPGAPGHDIVVVIFGEAKSVEVKTRQYIDNPSEISRWPVNMGTKADADYFVFVELSLRTLQPTFYLLDNHQAQACYKTTNDDQGNCVPSQVRLAAKPNDFCTLSGDDVEATPPLTLIPRLSQRAPAKPTKSSEIVAREAEVGNKRVVQYANQTIEVFIDGAVQDNTIESLRHIAKQLGVSERNAAGGLRNTRQLGKEVIAAIHTKNGG